MSQPLTGHCHCGAIRAILETSKTAAELPLRACQCGFCRRHGALTTSDPEGFLHIEAAPGSLNRYRFGQRLGDFLLCAECGVYVAATVDGETGLLAVLNVTGVALPGFEGRTPEPMTYDDETPDQKLARRKARWMPAVFVETQPSA
ncbi:aldehyde-activating protein [Phenylobacterium hankyongense]|uniref:Aldehyde-activating protein n=1 Tax=Phenylobacterium hankyongense TaxID=1813876 RepID=A0A328B1T9_9CAUL|nr:aldehyde-activating protein [Phenylobacterium hankyongense]RAK61153.1 aldehyde-activating protein [Phenylobacterium hankyongense]